MNTLIKALNPYNPIFYLIIIWSIVWKGIALWHSARSKQLAWYIGLLIINTAGILEILYIYFFRKRNI